MKIVNFIFQLSQLIRELIVIDYGGLVFHFAQNFTEPLQFRGMIPVSVPDDIVAIGTIWKSILLSRDGAASTKPLTDATALPVVFIFLAPVTLSSFDVFQARTLSGSVTLEISGSYLIAFAFRTAFDGEPVLPGFAVVASQSNQSNLKYVNITTCINLPGNTRSAITLSAIHVTGLIKRSNGVTVAALATLSAQDAEEPVFALVTVRTDYVTLALARSSCLIANRFAVNVFGAWRETLALFAIAFR